MTVCKVKNTEEFKQMVNVLGEDLTYYIVDQNNGNTIDKAPNGKNSKLFKSLLELHEGDVNKSIKAKARIYSKDFRNWFGDWIDTNTKLKTMKGFKTSNTISSKLDFANRGKGNYIALDKPFIEIGVDKKNATKVEVQYNEATNLDATTEEGQAKFMKIKQSALQSKSFNSIDEMNQAVKDAMLKEGYTSLTGFIEQNDKTSGRELVIYKDVNVNSKENVSKVVDENGEPLIVYHGTESKFSVFIKQEGAINDVTGTKGLDDFYFTSNKRLADAYSVRMDRVIAYYAGELKADDATKAAIQVRDVVNITDATFEKIEEDVMSAYNKFMDRVQDNVKLNENGEIITGDDYTINGKYIHPTMLHTLLNYMANGMHNETKAVYLNIINPYSKKSDAMDLVLADASYEKVYNNPSLDGGIQIDKTESNFVVFESNQIKSAIPPSQQQKEEFGLDENKVGKFSEDENIYYHKTLDKSTDNTIQQIHSFISKLGFTVQEVEDMESISGFGALSATDLLSKTIYLSDKNKKEAFTKEAAYVIFEMLGNKNVLKKELIQSVKLLEDYDIRISKFNSQKLSQYAKDKLVAIDYLQELLVSDFDPTNLKLNPIQSKDVKVKNKFEYLLLKLKIWWNKFKRNHFKKSKQKEILNIFNTIANDVLNNNYKLFPTNQTTLFYNADEDKIDIKDIELFNLEKELENNPKIKLIYDKLKGLDYIVSGSSALSMQGTVYRESFNDLDFLIPYDKVKKADYIKELQNTFDKVEFGEPYFGVYGARAATLTVRINDTINIDFFLSNSEEYEDSYTVTPEGYQNWESIFDAKVRIGSQKHINDLIRFKPFRQNTSFNVGMRHYNFDFIQGNYNELYDYKDDSTRIYDNKELENIDFKNPFTSESYSDEIFSIAEEYLASNGLNVIRFKDTHAIILANGNRSNQFNSLLEYHKGDVNKATIDYWKTFSENFKAFYGNIEGRSNFKKFKIGKESLKYSKKATFVDENGEPVIQYHGAGTAFDEFNKDYFLSGEGVMAFGAGFYGTNYKATADNYARTSKALRDKIKELIEANDEKIIEFNKKYKNETNLANQITKALQGSDPEEDLELGELIDYLGLHKTLGLYVSISNPINWFAKLPKQQKDIFERAFNLKLPLNIKGGNAYNYITQNTKLSQAQVSAILYNNGIDGTIHPTSGGRTLAGFSHKKGEIHFVAFETTQMKSVNNSGLFSKNNGNIYDPIEISTEITEKDINLLESKSIEKDPIQFKQPNANELAKQEKIKHNRFNAFKTNKTEDSEPVGLNLYEEKVSFIKKKLPFVDIVESDDFKKGEFAKVEMTKDKTTIYVNKEGLKSDSLMHEFGHIFIDSLGGMSNELIKSGRKYLEGSEVEAEVIRNYPELTGNKLDKEIVATALGTEINNIFENDQGKQSRFKRWLKAIFKELRALFGIKDNVITELANIALNEEFSNSIEVVDEYYHKEIEKTREEIKEGKLIERYAKQAMGKMKGQLMDFKKKAKKYDFFKAQKLALESTIKNASDSLDNVKIIEYIKQADKSNNLLLGSIKYYEDNEKDVPLMVLKNIKEQLDLYNDLEQVLDMLKTEKDFKDFVKEHANTFKLDNKGIVETENNLIYFANYFSHLLTRQQLLKQKYDHIVHKEVAKKLQPYVKQKLIDRAKLDLDLKYKQSDLKITKEEFIKQELSTMEDSFDVKALTRAEELLVLAPKDITSVDRALMDPRSLNDELIAYTVELLDKQDFLTRKNFHIEYEKAVKLYDAFEKERSSNNKKEQYSIFIENKKDGTGKNNNLVGKYYSEVFEENVKFLNDLYILENEDKKETDEYKKLKKEYTKWKRENIKDTKIQTKADKKWKFENAGNSSPYNIVPKDKWLNPQFKEIQKMSKAVKELYFFIDDLNKRSNANIWMGKPRGMAFPKIAKTGLERVTDEGLLYAGKEALQRFYKVESDTDQYGELGESKRRNVEFTKLGYSNPSNTPPILFRRDLSNDKAQSYDLLSIFLMDFHMSENFKNKSHISDEVELLSDIVKERNVIEYNYKGKLKLKNKTKTLATTNDYTDPTVEIVEIDGIDYAFDKQLKSGADSNVYQTLNSIIEDRISGIGLKGDPKVNQVIQNLMGLTSDIALMADYLGTMRNLISGKLFSRIESAGRTVFSGKDINEGDKEYLNDLQNISMDITRRHPHSKTNLLNIKFDALSDFNTDETRFATSGKKAKIFNKNSLHINSMGEHNVQSTIMYAVLNAIKVTNSKGEYLTKEGKVTKDKDKAYNLKDAYKLENGKVTLDSSVNYTTLDSNIIKNTSELDFRLSMRIKEVIKRSQGNYDNNNKAEIQRTIYGKVLYMFRKWMPSGYKHRLRNMTDVFTGNLENRADNFHYNKSTGEFETGTYSSAAFYVKNMYSMLKDKNRVFKFNIAYIKSLNKEVHKDMYDMEIANLHRVGREILTSFALYVGYLVLSALNGKIDDDDKKTKAFIYTLTYLARSVYMETTVYADPTELAKVAKDPITILRTTTRLVDTGLQLLDPFEEDSKGNNKFSKKLLRMMPAFHGGTKSSEQLLHYIENSSAR